jgi:hypothetical protein
MGAAYAPTLRLYGLSPLWAVSLPASALLYTLMIIDSARRHRRGRGAEWKGRLNGGVASRGDFDGRLIAEPTGQDRPPFAIKAQNP